MVRFKKKIFLFNVKETWFTHLYSFWDIFSVNAYMHVKNAENKSIAAVLDVSHTLELELNQETEVISANFSKQIRQQVKTAENEGTTCYFHKDIDQFVDFFNDFAFKKDTYTINRQRIAALGDSIKLSFSVNNGKVLAAHSYLVDEELGIVRHFHSATKRLDEQYDRNLIGRANKYLTIKSILHFKEMGFKVFDFGGYAKDTEDESLKGINNYKLLFGGKIVPCKDYYSYSYWLLKKTAKLFGLTGKL